MKKLWNLKYWDSGEWQVIGERLDDSEKLGKSYCPLRNHLFEGLRILNPDSTRVCLLGQDPYPSKAYATGVAFSIPRDCRTFPPTLENIFKEYSEDLHYPIPTSGDLTPWCKRGVLLWNCIPSVYCAKTLSHFCWTEWHLLTEEIIDTLDKTNHVVFGCLGSVARDFFYKNARQSDVIVCSHPSPRGNKNSNTPFLGSRLFSTINAKLCEQGLEPIDWRLP